jgi:hypothetical protein
VADLILGDVGIAARLAVDALRLLVRKGSPSLHGELQLSRRCRDAYRP